jgi:ATP-dependent Clp protease ATP-binding subunit ClpA
MARPMPNFDAECRAAIDLAKRLVPDGKPLDVEHLLPALCQSAEVKARVPWLSGRIPAPAPVRSSPPRTVPVAGALQGILGLVGGAERSGTAIDLLRAVVASGGGREFLERCRLRPEEVERLKGELSANGSSEGSPARGSGDGAPPGGWRSSAERQEALRTLSSFGRMLTVEDLPERQVREREGALRELFHTLCQMTRRNAILVGPPGTGKTAVVYELARRLTRGDGSIPSMLRDLDVFELSPTFLRSGASVVGQYEERVKNLLEVLRRCPKVVLFVDEIHSLLQSGVHERGPFSDANEAFKAALGHGELTCIGCTTPAEYRRFIEPDRALERRFTKVDLAAPSREETVKILQARRPRVEAYYAPLRVPDAIIERAVALADDYLPSRYQPDKSIQILDRASAACAIATPRLPEVTEDSLLAALEATVGHGLRLRQPVSEEGVFQRLRSKIVGQDGVLREVAQAFVSGLGGWRKDSTPRGVFLFGGPTGTGKTETAVLLAELLGAGRQAMVRVDCSTLQGSGHDSGPSVNRLLGVPPGYVGYARGQGGILTRVRDFPECVVLFDEFEKADPGVGELLLRILDDGRLEDVDGNLLDFRRTFIILTTNAGCVYERRREIGLRTGDEQEPMEPRIDQDSLWADLRGMGLRQEFFARIQHVFLFQSLGTAAVRTLVEQQLGQLQKAARDKGFALTWDEPLVEHVASRWQPRFGVRHLTVILRNRVAGQISSADAQSELAGAVRIHLTLMDGPAAGPAAVGAAVRKREGDTLVIALA